MYKKLLVSLLSVALVASLLCGCAKTEVAQTSAPTEAQSETKSEESKVIMRAGELNTMTTTDFLDDPYFPTYFYDDYNSMILAFKAGKIDSMFPFPLATAKYIENNVEGVKTQEALMSTGTLALCIGTLKENIEINKLFNNAINELLSNGTVERLNEEYIEKYLRTKEEPKPVDMPHIDGANTVKIAITGDLPPIDFISPDGKPAGFNVALLSEISKLTNTNIELVQMNSGARLTALKTNAVDAVFYNMKRKYDNEDYEKSYPSKIDLPDEISITEPYYASRIYIVASAQKLDELAAKGLLTAPETQTDDVLNAGELAFASSTEEAESDVARKYGFRMNIKFFDNLNQMMLALRSGQIDHVSLLPKSTAKYIEARNDDMILYKGRASDNDRVKYSMATLEENKEVYNLLNDTLNEIIKDGTIKDIEKKYIDEFIEDKDNPRAVDMPHFDDAKTIKVAVTGNLPPLDFVSSDGEPAGYNIALLSEIAKRAKINIELVTMDEAAKLTALVTKNIDAIFWLSSIKYADERNTFYDCPKGVMLTDSYYEDELYVICPKGGKSDKRFSAN